MLRQLQSKVRLSAAGLSCHSNACQDQAHLCKRDEGGLGAYGSKMPQRIPCYAQVPLLRQLQGVLRLSAEGLMRGLVW